MNDTPEYMNPSLAVEQARVTQTADEAASRLRALAASGGLAPIEKPEGFRTWMAPTYPNARFLIRPGTIQKVPYQLGAPMGIASMSGRDGDVWAKFVNGVLSTDDPEINAWCEAHSGDPDAHVAYHNEGSKTGDCVKLSSCKTPYGLCREDGPNIDTWAELKMGQTPTSRRPAIISPEINVDALMGMNPESVSALRTGAGARMREQAGNNDAARQGRQHGVRD